MISILLISPYFIFEKIDSLCPSRVTTVTKPLPALGLALPSSKAWIVTISMTAASAVVRVRFSWRHLLSCPWEGLSRKIVVSQRRTSLERGSSLIIGLYTWWAEWWQIGFRRCWLRQRREAIWYTSTTTPEAVHSSWGSQIVNNEQCSGSDTVPSIYKFYLLTSWLELAMSSCWWNKVVSSKIALMLNTSSHVSP